MSEAQSKDLDGFQELLVQLGIDKHPEFDALLAKICAEGPKIAMAPSYAAAKKSTPREKAKLVCYLVEFVVLPLRLEEAKTGPTSSYNTLRAVADEMMESLLRTKLEFSDEELVKVVGCFLQDPTGKSFHLRLCAWPIGHTSIQVEKHVKAHGMSDELRSFLEGALQLEAFETRTGWGADASKAKRRLEVLLHQSSDQGDSVAPFRLTEADVLSDYFNAALDQSDTEFRERIYEMCHHAMTVSSGKPSKKWQAASQEILSRTSIPAYKKVLQGICDSLVAAKLIETEEVPDWAYEDDDCDYSVLVYLREKNALLMKGLVWSLVQFHDQATIAAVARLAERCFKKIPGVGASCLLVGNACIYTLASSKGLDGLSQLTRLKLRVTQNNTRSLIQTYIDEASR